MIKRKLVLLALVMILLVSSIAYPVGVKELIGVVGGGLLVKTFAEPINSFINEVTINKGVKNAYATKVVPIVSVGSGVYIGAAQVSGPRDAVAKTKAVARLDVSFQGKFRVNIMIPIDSENPLERFRRVQGVGVSAIIDLRL
ncbi:MAG: hypothetical protein H5T91_02735 [Synergistetes bacterium]|nr:MAG: hypothetical protein XD52_1160 [bacterium 42_11]MBC7331337.1 hypothetical protein [Synergistota bacterium]MDK2871287.1 hypothetical protein [bacterium]